MFDKETCSCRCDAAVYRGDRLDCDARPPEDKMVWDETTCSCLHEGSDINSIIWEHSHMKSVRRHM